jgi:hypothetical protein
MKDAPERYRLGELASAHPGQGGWRPPNQGAPELWDFCNARQIFNGHRHRKNHPEDKFEPM